MVRVCTLFCVRYGLGLFGTLHRIRKKSYSRFARFAFQLVAQFALKVLFRFRFRIASKNIQTYSWQVKEGDYLLQKYAQNCLRTY